MLSLSPSRLQCCQHFCFIAFLLCCVNECRPSPCGTLCVHVCKVGQSVSTFRLGYCSADRMERALAQDVQTSCHHSLWRIAFHPSNAGFGRLGLGLWSIGRMQLGGAGGCCWPDRALSVLEPRAHVCVCIWGLSEPSPGWNASETVAKATGYGVVPCQLSIALSLVGCSLLNDLLAPLTPTRAPVSANSNSSRTLMWFLENFFVSVCCDCSFFHFL